jgi:uncharacterized protein YutE (UPF0331/DUF86 family)
MPSLNKDLVYRKLKDLDIYLGEPEPLISVTLIQYQNDYVKRHAVEKLIELVVEIASDINRLIIEGNRGVPPESYFGTFSQLGELEILPKQLSSRLASTTGLRNRLVHHYEDIEHKVVYHSAIRLVKDYRQYFELIEEYLQADHHG